MREKQFRRYYFFTLVGLLLASLYPIYMGVRVVGDVIADGTVMKENYPKYIIPYTPISLALIVGTALMPLCMKLFRRFALLGGSAISVAAFFSFELLLENKVIVTAAEQAAKLEDWQMLMCVINPVQTTYRVQTPVEILMGEYSPAFKLHFYVIALLLILTVLNCFYGFGQVIKTGDKRRSKPLAMQSAATGIFLGLCILACFTAFWRDGSLEISSLSASLMTVFFILLGMVGGIYVGSLLTVKRKMVSVAIPAGVASILTALMYVGEMILLNGHLYSFGDGFLFDSLPGIVLAPVDILVILAAGGLTALLCRIAGRIPGSES